MDLGRVGLFTLLTAVACGGSEDSGASSSATCATNPLSCGADKTCWLVDLNTGRFDCLPAATDKAEGSPCQNLVGQAQCNAGLSCFPDQNGSAVGTCQPFCATNQTCANAGQCTGLKLQSAPNATPIWVCSPAGTGGMGGSDGGGGAGGSAGASDAGTD